LAAASGQTLQFGIVAEVCVLNVRFVGIAAGTSIAVFALIDWMTGIDVLMGIVPMSNIANRLTAILSILTATALITYDVRRLRKVALVFGMIDVAASLWTLCTYFVGWPGPLNAMVGGQTVSHMAVTTACSFGLLGFGILFMELKAYGFVASQLSSLAAFAPPLLVVLSRLEGQSGSPTIGGIVPMTWLTALGLMGLSTGLLLSRPGYGLALPLSGPAAVVGKRLIPAALILPIGLDWACQYREDAHWSQSASSHAVPVLVSTFTLLVIIWWTAKTVGSAESTSISDKDALAESNRRLTLVAKELAAARDGAELANQAKSRFLSRMSHELRTPLNGVLGHAQLLQLEAGKSIHSARIASMLDAGRHLLRLVDGVLDMAKIQTDHFDLSFTDIDVLGLCHASLNVVRPLVEGKGLMLRFEDKAGASCIIATDAERLRQVMLNLLNDAMRSSEEGEILMQVAWGAQGRLRISVSGHGPTLKYAQRERLQAGLAGANDDSLLKPFGVGLALTTQLIHQMGGEIGYEEGSDGVANRFWFELPNMVATPLQRQPELKAQVVFPRGRSLCWSSTTPK
jgi:signal transduction histidine kinase